MSSDIVPGSPDPREIIRTYINLALDALRRAKLADPNKKAIAEWTTLAATYSLTAVRHMIVLAKDGK
jgi:hypothetical protein